MTGSTDATQAPAVCCAPASGRAPARIQAATVSAAVAVPGGRGDVVWLEGGRSHVGTASPRIPADGEGPRRRVRLKSFGIECFAVTNEQFAAFVAATGHVTDAERFGWSFVFAGLMEPDAARAAPFVNEVRWWRKVDAADWRRPEGPGSDLECRADHPVVHVSWTDAVAFAAWVGGRLPSEAEWEHAARGGRDTTFPWGDAEPSDDSPPCNIWQGRFPDLNVATDGYSGTAPVDAFAANGYGLYNMAGNVWEWCAERFRVRSLTAPARARDREALAAQERTLKGGSYLCHRSYCHRYRIAARIGRSPDSSTGHMGFRVAYDPDG